jgi:hypothetical protein
MQIFDLFDPVPGYEGRLSAGQFFAVTMRIVTHISQGEYVELAFSQGRLPGCFYQNGYRNRYTTQNP